ncbi:hypothetical protein RYH73_23200 [Olivibacter sp. CPCC 100613]|uniref:hypothetical protein n=1 Tax=Olivibacter sp. CPCC 100613 TaxID=3079931 RepID=UPI002FF74C93
MEVTTTTIHQLKWDFPDTNEFYAVITNGKITALHFQDMGDLTSSDLCSTNEKYLRNIYKALEGFFQHLDSIRNVGNIQTRRELDQDTKSLNPFEHQMNSLDLEKNQVEHVTDFEGKIRSIKQ